MKITVTNKARLSGLTDALRKQLTDELTIDNPAYIEARRFNRWTGNIPKRLKCFELKADGSLITPRGFSHRAASFVERCDIDDQTRELPEISFESSPTLRDYQETAFDAAMKYRFGVISAPTGSGKTVMALALVAARKQPTIIIVHTKELLNQWRDRVQDFLGIPREEIGIIGNGSHRIGPRITVALVQSVYRRALELKPRFGHLIIDECHRTSSRTFTEAASAFDSKYMLGLSATPYRRDKLSDLIFWHLGPLRHEVPKDALIKSGKVLASNIVIRRTKFVSDADLTTAYAQLITDLTEDKERNARISADVIQASATSPGISLVLSDRKAHCEALQTAIVNTLPRLAGSVAVLTGETKPEPRAEIVRRLDARQIKILIATGQLIGEGFDCKWLSNLFLCTPIKFGGRLIQYLGRVLRPADGKTHAVIYDYVDEQLYQAAMDRFKIYQQ